MAMLEIRKLRCREIKKLIQGHFISYFSDVHALSRKLLEGRNQVILIFLNLTALEIMH